MAHSPHRRWKGCQLCKPHKYKDSPRSVREPWPVLRYTGKRRRLDEPDETSLRLLAIPWETTPEEAVRKAVRALVIAHGLHERWNDPRAPLTDDQRIRLAGLLAPRRR